LKRDRQREVGTAPARRETEFSRHLTVLFLGGPSLKPELTPGTTTTTGGTRTRTPLAEQRILSPVRLPFRHGGFCGVPCLRDRKGWRRQGVSGRTDAFASVGAGLRLLEFPTGTILALDHGLEIGAILDLQIDRIPFQTNVRDFLAMQPRSTISVNGPAWEKLDSA